MTQESYRLLSSVLWPKRLRLHSTLKCCQRFGMPILVFRRQILLWPFGIDHQVDKWRQNLDRVPVITLLCFTIIAGLRMPL